MTGGSSPTFPSLPWKTKLFISALSFVTDAVRRPNGTINRRILNLLDPTSGPNAKPVRGVRTADVPVDPRRDLWFRLYLPDGADADAAAALPVVVFFHGGGFAFLSPSSSAYDAVCRRFCRKIPVAVLSVNYRRSPEHRYPAPYDDGVDVLRFLDSRGGGDGGPGGGLLGEFFRVADLSRCFLAGDSAGGNIAHHVARRWTAGEAPPSGRVRLAGLLPIQPFFGGEVRAESEVRLAGAPLVNSERTDWLWKAFLPPGADRDHEASNPVAAVEGLGADFPPALVVVGGFDPLQDWQRKYYEALRGKGKDARLVEYPGAIHAFYVFPELKDSAALVEEVRAFVRGRAAGDQDGKLAKGAVE